MHNQPGIPALETIRRNRGISLEQIAASTKIGVRALEAIEHGDFGKLPGGIYTTSYIRQYARAIDYDAQEILDAYKRTMHTDEPPASRTSGGGGFRGFTPASGTTV
jgi:cytoskeleton protein RodZ